MKTLAMVLTVLSVLAWVAVFVLAYSAIFLHSNELGGAAFITVVLAAFSSLFAAYAWEGIR